MSARGEFVSWGCRLSPTSSSSFSWRQSQDLARGAPRQPSGCGAGGAAVACLRDPLVVVWHGFCELLPSQRQVPRTCCCTTRPRSRANLKGVSPPWRGRVVNQSIECSGLLQQNTQGDGLGRVPVTNHTWATNRSCLLLTSGPVFETPVLAIT